MVGLQVTVIYNEHAFDIYNVIYVENRGDVF